MKLLLLTHGEFCKGIEQSYRMIAGENDNIFSVSLNDEGIQDFITRLANQIEKFGLEKVLIMTDIKGGTPYNEAFKYFLSDSSRFRVISGVNLPMVIEVGLNMEHKSLDDLAMLAIEVGREGIEQTEESTVEEDIDF